MGALFTTEAQRLINYALREGGKTYTIGLFLTNPTRAGSGTEASGGNYARAAITFGAPSEVGGKQVVSNSAAVDFGVMTAALGTIGYWAVYDNTSAGKFFGSFSTPKTFDIGDAIEIAIGEVDCIIS